AAKAKGGKKKTEPSKPSGSRKGGDAKKVLPPTTRSLNKNSAKNSMKRALAAAAKSKTAAKKTDKKGKGKASK
ncbi:hypothetical protein BD311DRAFT_811255, partial [Dichomitus squalens]